jgi:hypothetical protein
MLGDDAAGSVDAATRSHTQTAVTPGDLARCAEPSVRQLLDELKQKIGEAQRQSARKPEVPTMDHQPNGPRRWWERCTARVSLVVRW